MIIVVRDYDCEFLAIAGCLTLNIVFSGPILVQAGATMGSAKEARP